MGNDKKIEHDQTSQSGELDDQQLDAVSGGMGFTQGFHFTLGHTVYEGSIGVSTENGISGSLRGIASR